jgi:hypothetical protein
MENPEPTETEHELAGSERHQDEEDMRGVKQEGVRPDEDDTAPGDDTAAEDD